jgi:hypothetical protein
MAEAILNDLQFGQIKALSLPVVHIHQLPCDRNQVSLRRHIASFSIPELSSMADGISPSGRRSKFLQASASALLTRNSSRLVINHMPIGGLIAVSCRPHL